ncbi:MAG: ABC transporter ATP-binding protein/permease [Verrucomicrobia bacterium]|nr:ABC transporter ATP-binding protein/permease [Verrucomicrobiota bacterium]
MHHANLQFDKKFFRDFWKLLTPYWKSEEKKAAWLLLLLLTACVLSEVAAGVGYNYFYKFFYDALQTFNTHKVINSIFYFVIVRAAFVLSETAGVFVSGKLNIRWRQWLTNYYLKQWLSEHAHYRLQFSNQKIDNPDQRISEDVEEFVTITLNLFFGTYMIFQSLLYGVSFGFILWQISKNFVFHFASHSFVIPGYLLWVALLFATIGIFIINWLGKNLSFLDYVRQYLNANFRFGLIRMREASEQVSLSRGEKIEEKKFHHLFDKIVRNFLEIVSLKTKLAGFNRCYDYLSFATSFAVSVPFYMSKAISLGLVMQINSAYGSAISSAFVYFKNFDLFSDWRAVIHRLTEFEESIKSLPTTLPQKILIKKENTSSIIVSDLQLELPHGKKLLHPINLEIARGEKILLKGPSGCGKSTFLRALAGLWTHGEGSIILPKEAKVLFLPQKSYLPLGTFKELICYPQDAKHQQEFDAILKLCFLEKFLPDLHEEKSWSHQLSLGEQQRLSFARIFFYKPDLLFLDESTSSLDETTEAQLYKNLALFLPKLTLISIGHRKTLEAFHERMIDVSFLIAN